MLQRTSLRRLFSKPITQGYVAELPRPPATAKAAGHQWSRAVAAHAGVADLYYTSAHFRERRMHITDGDLPEEAEAKVAERYASWYAATYEVPEVVDRGSLTRAQQEAGDAAAVAEIATYDLEGVQEELQYWDTEFHHGTVVR